MTLKEVIKERTGQMAKIGSGNSFVYCGEITENLPELLDRLSDDEFTRVSDRLRRLNNYLSRFDHLWACKLEHKMDEFYKSVHSKHLPIDMVQQKHKKLLEKFEKEKATDLRLTRNGIDLYSRRLEEWEKFTDRKVKEIYPSFEEGIIIIFEGEESGRYWSYEEYEEENR